MPDGPATLAIDIGGTGLKASVLDPLGAMMADRVRVLTPYPLTPEKLVSTLVELVKPLPPYDRVSAGFPGVVRNGRVLTAPHFVTESGPAAPPEEPSEPASHSEGRGRAASEISPVLEAAWTRFDIAGALAEALGKPTKVVNDADLQGAAVVTGSGIELVVTLGTGMGTGLFSDGQLAPHLEISHHPFRHGETYDEQLGDVTRKRIGNKKWNRRVKLAFETLYALILYDHLYVGGGNSRHVDFDLGPNGTIVDNTAGILGGIKLWAAGGTAAAPPA